MELIVRNRRAHKKKSAPRRRLKLFLIKMFMAGLLFVTTIGIHNFSPSGKAFIDKILSNSTDLYAIQNSAIEFIKAHSD